MKEQSKECWFNRNNKDNQHYHGKDWEREWCNTDAYMSSIQQQMTENFCCKNGHPVIHINPLIISEDPPIPSEVLGIVCSEKECETQNLPIIIK